MQGEIIRKTLYSAVSVYVISVSVYHKERSNYMCNN